MKKHLFLLVLTLGISFSTVGQKINTDSLLMEATRSFKSQEYIKALEQGKLGIKISPDYYDFHMLLGRVYLKVREVDSAQYYFKEVIRNAPVYKDAFTNAIKLDIDYENIKGAWKTIQHALIVYPEEKEFYLSKLKFIQLQDNERALIEYLEELTKIFPSDSRLQQLLRDEISKHESDRIGTDYSHSIFDRDGVGPWHLTGLQYIRERRPLTLIARVSYADRRSQGVSVRSGYQYTLESYIKTGKKGVSYISTSYSPDILFPELLFSGSYFHYFDSAWEAELGGRYIKTSTNSNIYVAAVGLGKYVGSSWLNLKSYLFFDNGQTYTAINGTFRYYFNTKYDYVAFLSGYGTSPDESANITQFDSRKSLDSYRVGAAYNKLLGDHLIVGMQFIFNRQEYVINKKQNQFDFFMSLQFKL